MITHSKFRYQCPPVVSQIPILLVLFMMLLRVSRFFVSFSTFLLLIWHAYRSFTSKICVTKICLSLFLKTPLFCTCRCGMKIFPVLSKPWRLWMTDHLSRTILHRRWSNRLNLFTMSTKSKIVATNTRSSLHPEPRVVNIFCEKGVVVLWQDTTVNKKKPF